MIFVGYEPGSKAYRLLNQATGKIIVSRDVRFVEEEVTNEQYTEVEFTDDSLINEKTSVCSKDTKQEENEEISICSKHIKQEEKSTTSSPQEDETKTEIIKATNSTISGEAGTTRKSEQRNKGKPPERFRDMSNMVREAHEPRSFYEALTSPDAQRWEQAIKEELDALIENNTWDLVDPPEDRTIIGSKWVFKIKRNEAGDVTRYKARLVAQGFSQKFGIDYDEIFAPVVRQVTIRILLTIAGKKNWIVKHFDAKTAFINGELKEIIFMQQPEGNVVTKEDKKKVCRLKKSIYGLKQAAKSWNDKLKEELESYGFIRSEADPCLFIKEDNKNCILLAVYVDDMLVTGNSLEFIVDTMQILGKSFKIIDLGDVEHYVGIGITRDDNGIFYLNQRSYIQKIIENIKMEDSKSSAIPLDLGYFKLDSGDPLNNNQQYQKLIGELLYVAVNTRLDVMASVCILAQRTSAPTQVDWNEAKRVLRYLKGTIDLKLKLGPRKRTEYGGLISYADADWGQDRRERKSNSGYICQFNGATISWSCKKQTCVALSSTEAEIIALSEACKEILWIRQLLADLKEQQNQPIVIYEDNQSCINSVINAKYSNRTKHVDTKYHFARDLQSKGLINIKYCPTENILADMLTKPLGGVRLKKLCYSTGLRNCEATEGSTIAVEEE